jgi:hypothetical protein
MNSAVVWPYHSKARPNDGRRDGLRGDRPGGRRPRSTSGPAHPRPRLPTSLPVVNDEEPLSEEQSLRNKVRAYGYLLAQLDASPSCGSSRL